MLLGFWHRARRPHCFSHWCPSNGAPVVWPHVLPHREPRAGLGPPLPPSPQRAFSPSFSRIGRKAAILVQLLIFAVMGLSTAFVNSFDLYMVLRFAVATAVSGYAFSGISLRGYLSPEAFSHRLRPWRLATFPRLTGSVGAGVGTCQEPSSEAIPALPELGLRPQP